MAIVQGQCTIFKLNLLNGQENFSFGYTYKVALYTASANLDASTLTYTTDGEVVGGGYTAGGEAPNVFFPEAEGTTAYVSFSDITWNPAYFTARGALIYNSTTGAAVAVLDFGADKTANGTFTITFPARNASSAIIRIA